MELTPQQIEYVHRVAVEYGLDTEAMKTWAATQAHKASVMSWTFEEMIDIVSGVCASWVRSVEV